MKELGLKTFHAKISLKNQPSIQLFESKFNYYEIAKSEVFQEITLEWTLLESTTQVKMDDYGNEIEAYGSKATAEQRHKVKEMNTSVIAHYQKVVKGQYQ
jgi:hypothetical protein